MGNQTSRIPEGSPPCLLTKILISRKAVKVLLHMGLATISSGRWEKNGQKAEALIIIPFFH
jgi:hypothetical protein